MSAQTAMAIVLAAIAGLCVTAQAPLSNAISQRATPLQAAWIIHVAGALVGGLALLLVRPAAMAPTAAIGWRALLAGSFGMVTLLAVAISVGRLGVVASVSILIAAQLIGSTLVDNFGLLDQPIRTLTAGRVAGLVLLMVGAYFVVRS